MRLPLPKDIIHVVPALAALLGECDVVTAKGSLSQSIIT